MKIRGKGDEGRRHAKDWRWRKKKNGTSKDEEERKKLEISSSIHERRKRLKDEEGEEVHETRGKWQMISSFLFRSVFLLVGLQSFFVKFF